jgi:Uma2 family endonuclease
MSVIAQGRSWRDQAAFNSRVWSRLVSDPTYASIPDRVETDRDGQVVISPPPSHRHSRRQAKIATLLEKFLSAGFVLTECAVSTTDGVKAADVAWFNPVRIDDAETEELPGRAPDLCVEVASRSNSGVEIDKKRQLYFSAGASEMWVCELDGRMSFYGPEDRLEASRLCPTFPGKVG